MNILILGYVLIVPFFLIYTFFSYKDFKNYKKNHNNTINNKVLKSFLLSYFTPLLIIISIMLLFYFVI